MQAKMDQLVAVATVRQPETYTPPARSSNPPPSSSRKPKTKRTGDRSSFRTEIAGVASTARPYACARCGGRALHDVGRCEKTHFAKPSCATYETITRRDKADGPLIFKDTGTVVCLNFNGGRACNYKGCPGHRCSLCGADAWASVPEGLGLGDRYADVVQGLREGFDLEIPRITSTAIASNAPSANIHRSALREIILKERQRGAYIGPFQNAGDVQDVLHNAFQSMPLSLIPKPPDKFRLIQNFSASVGGSKATNDLIPRSWATTWSTFRQIIGNILSLPADSEACTRDVDSAYRLLPVHPSQWPALVLRTEEGFFIDTRVSFGIGPGTGVFGRVGEAALDIFRARGFGPLGRWVDDILFFRVRQRSIAGVNAQRSQLSESLGPQPFLRR
ncbi:hypothetical protein A4X06_0g9706, partial [Tilletia controversa]